MTKLIEKYKRTTTYWFDKNGIYSGSEFVEIITDAITDSKRMRYGNYRHQKAFSSVTRCYVTHTLPTHPMVIEIIKIPSQQEFFVNFNNLGEVLKAGYLCTV